MCGERQLGSVRSMHTHPLAGTQQSRPAGGCCTGGRKPGTHLFSLVSASLAAVHPCSLVPADAAALLYAAPRRWHADSCLAVADCAQAVSLVAHALLAAPAVLSCVLQVASCALLAVSWDLQAGSVVGACSRRRPCVGVGCAPPRGAGSAGAGRAWQPATGREGRGGACNQGMSQQVSAVAGNCRVQSAAATGEEGRGGAVLAAYAPSTGCWDTGLGDGSRARNHADLSAVPQVVWSASHLLAGHRSAAAGVPGRGTLLPAGWDRTGCKRRPWLAAVL